MSDQDEYYGINRYLCSVLEDMRRCCETLNFSPMKGLVEEAQIFGNRMESALADRKDLRKMNEQHSALRKKIMTLRKEVKDLEKKLPKKPEKK